jgi:hypothetical protein
MAGDGRAGRADLWIDDHRLAQAGAGLAVAVIPA